MRRQGLVPVLVTALALATMQAQAQLGIGGRPLALGGAYTAISDDIYAPYWNPAGVANLRGVRASLSSIQLRVTGPNNLFELVDGFPSDTQSQIDLVRRWGRGNSTADASIGVGVSTKGFAVTVIPYASGLVSPNNGAGFTYVNTPAGESVPVAGSTGRITGSYGFLTLLTASTRTDKRTTAGMNFKILTQQGTNIGVVFNDNLGNATTTTTTTSNTTSFGIDLGVLFQSSKDVMLGATLQNFIRPGSSDLFPTRLNLGIAYRPVRNFIVSADLTSDEVHRSRLNFGAEYSFGSSFAIRAGLFEGQPTIGLGLFNIINVVYSPNDTVFGFGFSF
jgi:hypothetical protein